MNKQEIIKHNQKIRRQKRRYSKLAKRRRRNKVLDNIRFSIAALLMIASIVVLSGLINMIEI